METAYNLPLTAPGPGIQQAKFNQTMADQALTKLNCQLDQRSINISREKNGVGFVTGSIDERATRVDEGLLVFALKETLGVSPDAKFFMRQQKPLIPARGNTAGIGEPGWSEAQFIDSIIVIGISVMIGDETFDREQKAPRPMFAAVTSGMFRLTNFSGNAIRPFHPVMWTPRANSSSNGRAVAVRGHSNAVPYLSLEEYDPEVHAFSRETLKEHRLRADQKKNVEDVPGQPGKKRFVTAFDEAFDQFCVSGAASALLESIILIAAPTRKTPSAAFAHAWAQRTNEPYRSLFTALDDVLKNRESERHTVHRAYLAPINGVDSIGTKADTLISSPLIRELAKYSDVQKNGRMLEVQAVRRFDEFFTSRLLGYFPHGCHPGETNEFKLQRPGGQ